MLNKAQVFDMLIELDRITAVRSSAFNVVNAFQEICQPNPLRQALWFSTTNNPSEIQIIPFSLFNVGGQSALPLQIKMVAFHRDKDFKMVTDGWYAISFNGPTPLVVMESMYTG